MSEVDTAQMATRPFKNVSCQIPGEMHHALREMARGREGRRTVTAMIADQFVADLDKAKGMPLKRPQGDSKITLCLDRELADQLQGIANERFTNLNILVYSLIDKTFGSVVSGDRRPSREGYSDMVAAA